MRQQGTVILSQQTAFMQCSSACYKKKHLSHVYVDISRQNEESSCCILWGSKYLGVLSNKYGELQSSIRKHVLSPSAHNDVAYMLMVTYVYRDSRYNTMQLLRMAWLLHLFQSPKVKNQVEYFPVGDTRWIVNRRPFWIWLSASKCHCNPSNEKCHSNTTKIRLILKIAALPKSVGFILMAQYISVQNIMASTHFEIL